MVAMPKHVMPFSANFDKATFDKATLEGIAKLMAPSGGIILVGMFKDEMVYYSEWESWHKFGDPNKAEEPKTYRSISAAIRKLRKVQKEFENAPLCLAFWVHPDSGWPLDKYMQVTGHLFPGSPRH